MSIKRKMKTMDGNNAAEVLEALVFVLDGRLEPVFAVKIHNDSALVEADLALKIGLYGERKEFFIGFKLQNGRVVVYKTVVGALPKVGARARDDLDFLLRNRKIGGLSCPAELFYVKFHTDLRGFFYIIQHFSWDVKGY